MNDLFQKGHDIVHTLQILLGIVFFTMFSAIRRVGLCPRSDQVPLM